MKYIVVRTKKQGENEVSFYTDCFEIVHTADSIEDARRAKETTAGYYGQDKEDYIIILTLE